MILYSDERVIDFRTLLGSDTNIQDAQPQECLHNIQRLGIIDSELGNTSDVDGYSALMEALAPEYTSRNTFTKSGFIKVTPFGVRFLEICVHGPPHFGAIPPR